MLDRITRERVPGTVAALELSRQAERIVSAAPALLAVDTKGKLRDVSEGIATEVRELEQLVANLGKGGLRAGALAQIEPAVEGLRRNLVALDGLMAQRLDIAARRQARLDQLSSTTIATMRLLAPGILVMEIQSRPVAAGGRRGRGRRKRPTCRDRCARRGDLRLSAAAEGAPRGIGDQRDPSEGGSRPHPRRAAAAQPAAPALARRARGAGVGPRGRPQARLRAQVATCDAWWWHGQHPRRTAGGTRCHRRGREPPRGECHPLARADRGSRPSGRRRAAGHRECRRDANSVSASAPACC